MINAHPRIGANPAQLSGAFSVATAQITHTLLALSYREQGYDKEKAAETEKHAAVLAELSRLNEEYEKKFGFKFIVWVAGRPKGTAAFIHEHLCFRRGDHSCNQDANEQRQRAGAGDGPHRNDEDRTR